MSKDCLNPTPALTFPGMSQATVSDNVVHISGQVALDFAGQVVGVGDPQAQAEQCLKNVEALILLAGGSLADIVKLTCFVTSAETYPAYAKAKLALFPEQAPAGTCVVVAALLDPRFLLEVEATAVIERIENTNR